MDSPELGPICDLLVSYVRFVKDGVRAQCVEAARASDGGECRNARVGAGLQPLMWALAGGVSACAVTFTRSRSCSARQTSDGGECRHGSTNAKTGGRSRRACMHAWTLQ